MAAKENRSDAYASKKNDASNSIEDLSNKLAADLRSHIQKLGMYPVLSPKWCEMSKSLTRISNITEMEEALPKDSKDSTLWEGEEVALRYLLEDGKLNLCLRLLVDVKNFQYEVLEHATTLDSKDEAELAKFEQSVGQIMRNAWKHVEAIQTTDLPLLIEHVAKVLKYAAKYPELVTADKNAKALPARQEVLVMYYFQDLLSQMAAEAVQEHRIMPNVKEHDITGRLVKHLGAFHASFRPSDNIVGCTALASIFDSEDFNISKAKYVPAELRPSIVELDAKFVRDLVKDDRGVQKTLRPLCDQIQIFKHSNAK